MPARLVYSPKVYAFTQQQSGAILDISKYVVSGQIDRKINQVSSASITLRNPQRRFTQPSTGMVAFHPMDPITIYLERMAGKPVRVFTGYLDTTPYYTLYPKTITLQASCTLKRLLYTYFDPSLPYTNAFFRKYGWFNLNDGTMWNLDAVTQKLDQTGNKTQDTSLGKLLWAILYDIGQWQDSNIYIENLPTDIVQKVSNLATNLKQVEDVAVKQFETFLSNVIGDGTQGSGGGPGASTQNASNSTTTAPASGGQVPATPTGGYTRNSWAIAFLQALGAPVNDANVLGVMNWTVAEDGTWNNGNKYNPLNTTQDMPGHVKGSWNSVGVKLYDNWDTGLKANVQTIKNGYYPNLLKHLMDGKGNLLGNETSELSTWGTGTFTASTPQQHTLKISRMGVATTGTSASNNPLSGSALALPPAQRGTNPLLHTAKQGARQTQSGHTAPATPKTSGGQGTAGTGSSDSNATVNGNLEMVAQIAEAAAALQSSKKCYSYTQTANARINNGNDPRKSPYTFDCSGFVEQCYKAAGLPDPVPGTNYAANSFAMESSSALQKVDAAQAVRGDIVVFPDHAVIYTGNGNCVSMGGQGDPMVTTVSSEASYNNRGTTGYYHLKGATGGTQVTKPAAREMLLSAKDYGPTRSAKDIKIIVLHSTEGDNTGDWSDVSTGIFGIPFTFATGPKKGQTEYTSIHYLVDSGGRAGHMVDDLQVAHHVADYNSKALGIEQVGHAAQTSWPKAQTDWVAKQVAWWAQKYNVPITHSTTSGVCMHSDLGVTGGDHHDPGTSYPLDQVLTQAQGILSAAQATVGAGASSTTDAAASNAFANAFVAQIEAPSLMDQVTATALGGAHMGLMHDQALLPFVQQVAQASMRSFQSLPNGDFYAFYPDYFGEFGQHNPYWLIEDLEILDGEINLSDDALATHVYAVGDTTWPISKGGDFAGQLMNMLQAGTIDIFSAFGDTKTLANTNHVDPMVSADDAVQSIKRYGPRPLVQQYPMVRSQYFEMFLAYQQFMLAWSNQFKTPFTFTFMPELFPGGKVAFSDHGLQMYIDSVSHSFDYAEGGFTTTAELSAPSVYGTNTDLLPSNMVKMSEAIFEPIRSVQTNQADSKQQRVQQQVVSALTEGASDVENALQNISLW